MIEKVFGTGGIGTGIFFNLKDNHTLGRDETRLGRLTDYKDYCKLHIILHYIAKLTNIKVYAIGKVGKDEQGVNLIDKMQRAGIKTDYVKSTDKARTMFAVCFQYPDGSGGNITTSNSACNLVTPEYIDNFNLKPTGNSLVIAVPEVPLKSRIKLLEIGRNHGAFNVASILTGEVEKFEKKNGYKLCDLLAVNLDEAKAISKSNGSAQHIAKMTAQKVLSYNRDMKLIVTAGRHGCFAFEKEKLQKIKTFDVPVLSTAGAGDALLAGTISGIVNKIPFMKYDTNENTLSSAVELGNIVATFAVMSPDTIAKKVSKENIAGFIKQNNLIADDNFNAKIF